MSATPRAPRRTEAGATELQRRALDLSRAERLILVLVDGRRSLTEVRAQLRSINDRRFDRSLRRLVELGLVEADLAQLPYIEPTVPVALPPEKALNESVHSLSYLPSLTESRPATGRMTTKRRSEGLPEAQAAEAAAPGRRLRRFAVGFGVAAAVVVAVGLAAAVWAASVAISPRRVEQHLSAVLGQPATVDSTELGLVPMPRVRVQGVRAGGVLLVPELSLEVNLRQMLVGLAPGEPWSFGIVRVPSATLPLPTAAALLDGLHARAAGLPGFVASVAVDDLRFDDAVLLPRRFRLHSHRLEGRFTRFDLHEVGGAGEMHLHIHPGAAGEAGPGWSRFEMQARRWAAPFGPAVTWDTVVANGRFAANALVVEAFQAQAFGGTVFGAAVAARDVESVFALRASAMRIDVAALLESLAGKAAASAGRSSILAGVAGAELVAAGRGENLALALQNGIALGPVNVERGLVNGVNLGLAAVHGGAAVNARGGGATRFSELGALLVADRDVVGLRNIEGRAGAMRVQGEIEMAPDHALDGRLRVILGGTRSQAPLSLGVRGTPAAPVFAN